MRIGLSTSCLYPLETEKALCAVCEKGCECTEIFFNALCELEEDFVDNLLEIKNRYNTPVVSVHPTMSLSESFMLYSAYERRYKEGLDWYKRYAEIAATLGAKYIIMHGGKPNKVLDDLGYIERFSQIAEAVEENGAVLLQENVVKFRAGNLDFLKLMKSTLKDKANFCLDIKQCIRGNYSPFDALEVLRESVKHIHISDSTPDNDCLVPSCGNFDFESFFLLAKEVGFKGDAMVEVYRDAYGDYAELFDTYKKFMGK